MPQRFRQERKELRASRELHASNPLSHEFTLCGEGIAELLIQHNCIGDSLITAAPGETITCERCRTVIVYVKAFRFFKVPLE